jgi:hypothetical protein
MHLITAVSGGTGTIPCRRFAFTLQSANFKTATFGLFNS